MHLIKKCIYPTQPLPEKYHNGVLTDYAIYGLKNVVNVSQRHFHHALPLDDVATYELYVKAVNEMGVNLTQPEVIQILPQSEGEWGSSLVMLIMIYGSDW